MILNHLIISSNINLSGGVSGGSQAREEIKQL